MLNVINLTGDYPGLTCEAFKQHLLHYINEVFEIFVAMLILASLTPKKDIDLLTISKLSLVMGLITFLIEIYNPHLKSNLKSGIIGSVGNSVIKVI
jgi:hypothetical protein